MAYVIEKSLASESPEHYLTFDYFISAKTIFLHAQFIFANFNSFVHYYQCRTPVCSSDFFSIIIYDFTPF